MRRILRNTLLFIITLFLIVAVGFVIWGETPARPMPEAIAALPSDSQVQVTTGKWLVFAPTALHPDTGLILYPGGRVDYRAYSPTARQIAEQGYLVIIVRMPLNLAVFGADAAREVQAAYPQISHWAIGGHSLGGAMAASYAANHPGDVAGLVLWAAYPAAGDDLSESDLQVVSISGSLDGLATREKIDASRLLLPADTTWVEISGGNHAQFGWYGDQAGDNPATITRDQQEDQIIEATLRVLENIK